VLAEIMINNNHVWCRNAANCVNSRCERYSTHNACYVLSNDHPKQKTPTAITRGGFM
jgi:hypothetical protein